MRSVAAVERRSRCGPRTGSRPRRLDQTQDRAARGRFAAARFADEAERFARARCRSSHRRPHGRAASPARTGRCGPGSTSSGFGSATRAGASRRLIAGSTRPCAPARTSCSGGVASKWHAARELAARREAAARLDVAAQRRNGARDLFEPPPLGRGHVDPRDRAQQALRVGMLRIAEQLLDRRLLHYLAART